MKLRGLRGSVFEDMINRTIEDYRVKHLALIQKIPTPIVPTKMDNEGHITLAYFDKKSKSGTGYPFMLRRKRMCVKYISSSKHS